jgi:hypothetical protein
MHPDTEVVKAVEVLPPEKPRLVLSGKRPGWVPQEGTAGVLAVVRKPHGRPSKYATPEGQELQKKAFERYQGMGVFRSLPKVAAELNVPVRDIQSWSFKFKWQNKIALTAPATIPTVFKATQDRVVEKVLKAVERQVELVKLKQAMMTREDPAEPGKELPTEDLTIYALKETGTVLLNVLKSLSEALGLKKTEKEIESAGDSPSGKGPKGGVMVNVIFKG